jgi:two-component system nitrate/nitrite sensor histidine kinase NarX
MYPRRRWAVVFGAIFLVGVVEALSDSLLDALLPFPLDTVLVLGVVATVAIVAAWYAFRLIDRLTGDLVERHEALKSRNAALRAVYDVSMAVSGQADPDETLVAIVDHARRLLRVDAALLVLCGPEDEVQLRACSAAPGALLEATGTATGTATGGPPGAFKAASIGVSGSDLARYLAPGYSIRLEAPVGRGEARVGTLGLAAALPRRFSDSDVETLSALATQVSLALEAARLRDELRALAVQGERERIAREMHDGLAQVLAYVNTKSQAVDEMLADGRVAEARKQLGELAAAARSVYVDVREAILSLSPPVLPERGLASALEEYAARYAESSKLAVRFQATPEANRAPLSAEIQAEVFGVAREALTNVRKHAHAQRVTIGLTRESAEVVLRISDDGVGFDPEVAGMGPEKWPHFGLAGMRERAEAVGGRVAWHSRPGAGSEVELRVPVAPGASIGQRPSAGSTREIRRPAQQHQAVQSSVPAHSEAD